MGKIKELFNKYKEIIMYIIFGVLTTLVNWVAYTLLIKAFGGAIENKSVMFTLFGKDITTEIFFIFIANFVAWVAGVAFAFVTNKIWVFESKSWKFGLVMKELWLFILARLITGVLEWFGVPLLWAVGMDQPLFGIDGFLAKIVVSIIVVILNYVFSKLIIFKNKDDKKQKLEKAAEELNQ
ncbi:GtrA family protein [Ruminococcus sp.]|uniref:GtrA family protein n=1 Tax=Ruminococcus sp. TaxID=41978 RepID=UPI00389065E5